MSHASTIPALSKETSFAIRPTVAVALVALIAVAVIVLPVASLSAFMPGTALVAANTAFLQGARQEAMTDVLLLADLDAVVSVIRTIDLGVSLGVSANVEVGQALSSLGQALRSGIAAAFFGAGFYEATLVAAAVATQAEPWALKLVAIFGLAHLGALFLVPVTVLRRMTRAAFELFLLLFLVLRIALPYGIATTAALSGVVKQELIGDARGTLEQMHADLTSGDGSKAVSLEGWASDRAARSAFEQAAADFPHNLEATAHYTTRRVAVSFIDGIVVPFGFVLLFAGLTRRIARDAFPVLP